MISRRNFIRTCCALGSLGGSGRFGRFGLMSAMAQSSPDYRALVCVFLMGGNDCNNLIVPTDSTGFNNYTDVRQGVALGSSSLLPIGAANGAPYGLHPNLAELKNLYTARHLAVLVNVGTLVKPVTRSQFLAGSVPVPDNLQSHFDQQTQWQSAVPTGTSTTGWAGRAADAIASLNRPSTFPALVSLAGNTIFANGAATQPATIAPGPLTDIGALDNGNSTPRATAFQQLLTFDTGISLIQAAAGALSNGMSYMSELQQAMSGAPALRTAFPNTPLGEQLQQVAQIMQVRQSLGMSRQIFFCSLDGFDTHGNLLNAQENLFTQVSQAMHAFYDATQEMGISQKVTTFTESEFGRTLQPTGIAGSDHGWGGHHLIMGDAVKGGDVYGTFPQLILGGPDDAGARGTWIPTTSLDQYGAALATWFGVSSANLNTVFPNLKNFSKTVPIFG